PVTPTYTPYSIESGVISKPPVRSKSRDTTTEDPWVTVIVTEDRVVAFVSRACISTRISDSFSLQPGASQTSPTAEAIANPANARVRVPITCQSGPYTPAASFRC